MIDLDDDLTVPVPLPTARPTVTLADFDDDAPATAARPAMVVNLASTPVSAPAVLQEAKFPNVRKFENMPTLEQIKEAADHRGLNLGGGLASLMSEAVALDNKAVMMQVDTGIYLLSVLVQANHGELMGLYESYGMSAQRGHEAMRIANAYTRLSPEMRDRLTSMPKTKVLALASADQEVLDDILSNDEKFDSFAALSVRDMRKALKKNQADIADKDIQIRTLQNQLKAVSSRYINLAEDNNHPVYVTEARHESAMMTKQAALALDELSRLHDEHMRRPYGDADAAYREMVSRAIFHAVNRIYVQSSEMLSDISRESFDDVIGDVEARDFLPDAHARRLANDYALITKEHEHQKLLRDMEREAARPRGRGRPKNREDQS